MGNKTSLTKKPSVESDSGDLKSKTLKYLKRNRLWDCVKDTNADDSHNCNEEKIQRYAVPDGDVDSVTSYERSFVHLDYSCLLYKQICLLKSLSKCGISTRYGTQISLDYMFDIAQKLRETGFNLSDEWLANLMLISLEPSCNQIVKELDNSKVKLTTDLIKRMILEHANNC